MWAGSATYSRCSFCYNVLSCSMFDFLLFLYSSPCFTYFASHLVPLSHTHHYCGYHTQYDCSPAQKFAKLPSSSSERAISSRGRTRLSRPASLAPAAISARFHTFACPCPDAGGGGGGINGVVPLRPPRPRPLPRLPPRGLKPLS